MTSSLGSVPAYEHNQRRYSQWKVYGAYNTGTNALTSFIRENFHTSEARDTNDLWWHRWKHTIDPRMEDHTVLRVVLVKSPMLWILSCAKSPYNLVNKRGTECAKRRRMTGEVVLACQCALSRKHPLVMTRKERLRAPCKRVTFSCAAELWRRYIEVYETHENFKQHTVLVRYEDFLHRPRVVKRMLANYISAKTRFVQILRPAKKHGKPRNRKEAKKWYTKANERRRRRKFRRLSSQITKFGGKKLSTYGYS